MAVGVGFDDLFPRPHLVERADHETHQHSHRHIVPVLEQPRQQVRKADDARHGAHDEDHDDRDIQVAHGLHDELVLAQQEQDEGARNAGQDHGADGDGARQHDEPPRVGGLGRRGDGDPPCGGRADQACGDSPDVPVPDLPGHEQRRGDDQPEEERPDGNRVVREQVGHQPRQREDGDPDPDQHGQQKTAVDVAPELLQTQRAEQPQGGAVHALDRLDQLLVDARNKGDRSSRYTGNHIGHAHGAALRCKQQILCKFHIIGI